MSAPRRPMPAPAADDHPPSPPPPPTPYNDPPLLPQTPMSVPSTPYNPLVPDTPVPPDTPLPSSELPSEVPVSPTRETSSGQSNLGASNVQNCGGEPASTDKPDKAANTKDQPSGDLNSTSKESNVDLDPSNLIEKIPKEAAQSSAVVSEQDTQSSTASKAIKKVSEKSVLVEKSYNTRSRNKASGGNPGPASLPAVKATTKKIKSKNVSKEDLTSMTDPPANKPPSESQNRSDLSSAKPSEGRSPEAIPIDNTSSPDESARNQLVKKSSNTLEGTTEVKHSSDIAKDATSDDVIMIDKSPAEEPPTGASAAQTLAKDKSLSIDELIQGKPVSTPPNDDVPPDANDDQNTVSASPPGQVRVSCLQAGNDNSSIHDEPVPKDMDVTDTGDNAVIDNSGSDADFSFHASIQEKETTSMSPSQDRSDSAPKQHLSQSPARSEGVIDKSVPDINLSDTDVPVPDMLPPLPTDDPLVADEGHPSSALASPDLSEARSPKSVVSDDMHIDEIQPRPSEIVYDRSVKHSHALDDPKNSFDGTKTHQISRKNNQGVLRPPQTRKSTSASTASAAAAASASALHALRRTTRSRRRHSVAMPIRNDEPRITSDSTRRTRASASQSRSEGLPRATSPRRYSTRSRSQLHSPSPPKLRSARLLDPMSSTASQVKRQQRKVPVRRPEKGDPIRVLWHIDQTYYEGVIESILSYRGKRFYDILYDSGEREFYMDLSVRKWRFADGRDGRTHDPIIENDGEPVDWSRFPKIGDELWVQWHVDLKYYSGVVRDILKLSSRQFYDIDYEGGDREFFLDLTERKWTFYAGGDQSSTDKNLGKKPFTPRNRRDTNSRSSVDPGRELSRSIPPSRNRLREATVRRTLPTDFDRVDTHLISDSTSAPPSLNVLGRSPQSGRNIDRRDSNERNAARNSMKSDSEWVSGGQTNNLLKIQKEKGEKETSSKDMDIDISSLPKRKGSNLTGTDYISEEENRNVKTGQSRRELDSNDFPNDEFMRLSTKRLPSRSTAKQRLLGRSRKISNDQPPRSGLEREAWKYSSDLGVPKKNTTKGGAESLSGLDAGGSNSQPSSAGSHDQDQMWNSSHAHSKRPGTSSLSSETPKKAQNFDAPKPPKASQPSMRIADIVQISGRAAQRWARDQTDGLSESLDKVDAQLFVLKQLRSNTTKTLKRRRAQEFQAEKERLEAAKVPEMPEPVPVVVAVMPNDDAQGYLSSVKSDIVNLVQKFRASVESREKTLKKQFVSLENELNDQNSGLLETAKALRKLDIKGIEALSNLEPISRKKMILSDSGLHRRSSIDGLGRSYRHFSVDDPSASSGSYNDNRSDLLGGDAEDSFRNLRRKVSQLTSRSDWLGEEVKRLQSRENDLVNEKRNAVTELQKAKSERDSALKTCRALSNRKGGSQSSLPPTSRSNQGKSAGISKRRAATRAAEAAVVTRSTGRANRKSLPPMVKSYKPPASPPKGPPPNETIVLSPKPTAPSKPSSCPDPVRVPLVSPSKTSARLNQQDNLWRQMDRQASELLGMISTVWLLQDESRSEPPKEIGLSQDVWVRRCVINCLKHAVSYLEATSGVMVAKRALRADVDGEVINTDWVLGQDDITVEAARSNYKCWEPGLEDAEWVAEKKVLRGLSTCYNKAMIATPAHSYTATIGYAKAIAQKAVVEFETFFPAKVHSPGTDPSNSNEKATGHQNVSQPTAPVPQPSVEVPSSSPPLGPTVTPQTKETHPIAGTAVLRQLQTIMSKPGVTNTPPPVSSTPRNNGLNPSRTEPVVSNFPVTPKPQISVQPPRAPVFTMKQRSTTSGQQASGPAILSQTLQPSIPPLSLPKQPVALGPQLQNTSSGSHVPKNSSSIAEPPEISASPPSLLTTKMDVKQLPQSSAPVSQPHKSSVDSMVPSSSPTKLSSQPAAQSSRPALQTTGPTEAPTSSDSTPQLSAPMSDQLVSSSEVQKAIRPSSQASEIPAPSTSTPRHPIAPVISVPIISRSQDPAVPPSASHISQPKPMELVHDASNIARSGTSMPSTVSPPSTTQEVNPTFSSQDPSLGPHTLSTPNANMKLPLFQEGDGASTKAFPACIGNTNPNSLPMPANKSVSSPPQSLPKVRIPSAKQSTADIPPKAPSSAQHELPSAAPIVAGGASVLPSKSTHPESDSDLPGSSRTIKPSAISVGKSQRISSTSITSNLQSDIAVMEGRLNYNSTKTSSAIAPSEKSTSDVSVDVDILPAPSSQAQIKSRNVLKPSNEGSLLHTITENRNSFQTDVEKPITSSEPVIVAEDEILESSAAAGSFASGLERSSGAAGNFSKGRLVTNGSQGLVNTTKDTRSESSELSVVRSRSNLDVPNPLTYREASNTVRSGAERLRQMKELSSVPDLNVPTPPHSPPSAPVRTAPPTRGRGRGRGRSRGISKTNTDKLATQVKLSQTNRNIPGFPPKHHRPNMKPNARASEMTIVELEQRPIDNLSPQPRSAKSDSDGLLAVDRGAKIKETEIDKASRPLISAKAVNVDTSNAMNIDTSNAMNIDTGNAVTYAEAPPSLPLHHVTVPEEDTSSRKVWSRAESAQGVSAPPVKPHVGVQAAEDPSFDRNSNVRNSHQGEPGTSTGHDENGREITSRSGIGDGHEPENLQPFSRSANIESTAELSNTELTATDGVERVIDFNQIGDLMNPPTPSAYPGMEAVTMRTSIDEPLFKRAEGDEYNASFQNPENSRGQSHKSSQMADGTNVLGDTDTVQLLNKGNTTGNDLSYTASSSALMGTLTSGGETRQSNVSLLVPPAPQSSPTSMRSPHHHESGNVLQVIDPGIVSNIDGRHPIANHGGQVIHHRQLTGNDASSGGDNANPNFPSQMIDSNLYNDMVQRYGAKNRNNHGI